MASNTALHCRLYDSTRQAIREASALGRQQEADLLQQTLDRLWKEAHDEGGGNQPRSGRSSGTPCHQQDEHDAEKVPISAHASGNGGAGGESSDATGVGRRREDECLGLLAEAFADDLDVLRKDSTFTGSSKNIAAMADMMRCLASGMDSTEQTMLLENATR